MERAAHILDLIDEKWPSSQRRQRNSRIKSVSLHSVQFSAPMTPNQFFAEGSTVIAWDLGFVFNIRLPHASAIPCIRAHPKQRRRRIVSRNVPPSLSRIYSTCACSKGCRTFEFLFRVQLQEDLVPLALAARSFCSGLSWRFPVACS